MKCQCFSKDKIKHPICKKKKKKSMMPNLIHTLKLHCLLIWERKAYKQDDQWPPCGHTYSIGFAECLEVDAVAFQRGKRRVPVAIVCLVVTHCEGLCDRQVGRLQLSSKVVQGIQAGGVPIAHRHRKALDDVSCPPWFLKSFLLDNQLVNTGQDREEANEFYRVGWTS